MKRNQNESFEDYKLRRSVAQAALKIYKKGTLFYSAVANRDHHGRPKPYTNPERSHLYARHRNRWHHPRGEKALAIYGGK